jgi:hypothetical protein
MTAAATPAAAPADAENPFVGLRPFDIDDADLFFGRNKQTYELLRRLHTLHFVAVLGPSGCGKSSLIRAGVLAALRDGYLADNGPWTIATLEPGVDPLAAWTVCLSPLLKPGHATDALLTSPADALDTSRGPLVILVDQFEDLFRYGSRSDKRGDVQQFIDAMLATGRADARIYLILTMRSEYLPECAVYADLAGAINEGLYLVPRMDREQMKQAIVGQVRKGGAAITTELVERLLDDAASEEDALPVLQHALMQIWPKRQRWEPMGLDLYPAAGGLATFLDQHAEAVYATLRPDLQDAAQKVFRAITETTAIGRPARRPLPFEKIVAEAALPGATLNAAIKPFVDQGFLRVKKSENATTIDITHEAIARQWRRLGSGFLEVAGDRSSWREGWITTEARERRALVALRDASSDWERNDKDKAYLFRGNRLERLLRDLGDEVTRVDAQDRAFLDASQRNDWWDHVFSRQVVGAALLGLVLVAAVVSIILFSANRARTADRRAESIEQKAAAAEKEATEQVEDAQSLATKADAEKLKAETLYRQVKETTPAVNPLPNPTVPTKPRLYTQLWNDDQERMISPILKSVAASLEIVVPHIERVTVGPSHDELRYFRPGDAAEAQHIASALSETGVKPRVSYVKGFESSTRIREGHFELWLAAPATTTQSTPDIGASQAPVIDSILTTAREYPPGLELRILGRWLDADAQIRIDGRPIDRSRVVVSVLAPSSSAKFATDLNLTLRDVNLQPPDQRHTLTLVNGNGKSTDASIQLGHLESRKKQ